MEKEEVKDEVGDLSTNRDNLALKFDKVHDD